MSNMPQNLVRPFPKKTIFISLVIVVVIVIGVVLLYVRDHKSVAITTLPASVQPTSNTATPSGLVEPLAANKLVQSFYTAFIANNQPTSVIQQYGTANLLAAYTKYYVHNSEAVSSQNYADGSIVCGSVKPKSITGVGTLSTGATSAQVQVVEVENKGGSTANQTATLAAEVIHQGNSLKINAVQCQELVGSDSHSAP